MTDKEIATLAVKQFNTDEIIGIRPYGNGLINSTWLVTLKDANGNVFRNLLQKINVNVFKNPDQLMDNIVNVTTFLSKKVQEDGTITVIPTLDNKYYHHDEFGNFWRVYKYIEDTIAYEKIQNDKDFYTCGLAFGEFQ